MLFVASVILSVFIGAARANNLPQNPDFSGYDMYAVCPQQQWVALSGTSYVVNGQGFLFVNKGAMGSAARLSFNIQPGIMNNMTFYAHVHNDTCANQGGGHFKANLSNFADTSDTNEYWFNFVQSGDGSVLTTDFAIDNYDTNFAFNKNAMSIVIHYPSTKIACCDLKLYRRYATCKSGFQGLNSFTSSGGAGALYVSTDMKASAGYLNFSVTDLNSTGFLDNMTFFAHVHNGTCAQSGQGHWRHNATADASILANTGNEFWWTFPGTGSGNYVQDWSSIQSNTNFSFDGFVKSIVVHAANTTKAACCDLTLEDSTANYTADLDHESFDMIGYCPKGAFVSLNAVGGVTYSFDGSSFLWADTTNNQSRGVLNFQSTPPLDSTLPVQAHVHMLTCDLMGGGHWKYDTSIGTTQQSNEFWFNPALTVDQPTGGTAASYSAQTTSTTVTLDKRPRSIVVHLNGTKLQCCNLEFVTKFASASSQAWTQFDPRVSVFGDVAVYVSDSTNSTAGDLNFQMFPGTSDMAYFAAHVHNANCSSGSGSHWKYDMSVTGASQNNEVWWTYNGTGDGSNTVSEFSLQMNNEHFAPYPAGFKSVVIHAPAAQGNAKLACVDLTLTSLGQSLTAPPTNSPTNAPTTAAPTTASPTNSPTYSPTTGAPTNAPTFAPTKSPTKKKGASTASVASIVALVMAMVMLFANTF